MELHFGVIYNMDKVESYVSDTEQNRILTEDASQLNLYTMDGFAFAKNRLLIYPANHFHSRYPFVFGVRLKKMSNSMGMLF